MTRRDIHIQTGLAVALLLCAAIALGTTGGTYHRVEEQWRPKPPSTTTRLQTDWGVSTATGANWTSTLPVPVATYTTTALVNQHRRQNTQPVAVSVPPTPLSTAPPTRATSTRARPTPSAVVISPPRDRYSGAMVGAIINMPWLALLIVYLIAFLWVRAVRPAAWFVTVAADLSFLGVFWLCGIVCGVISTVQVAYEGWEVPGTAPGFVFTFVSWAIITAWWIWEIVAAKRYRAGLRTSLVRLVEAEERGEGARPATEHVDLDEAAKNYLVKHAA
ncbi:hypothetical protein Q8F55_003221 [Vanrija albida]|uniref:MARVEL domain-containing protein n=1 Tax=Vanrija albida TaxID=181172 RepID=A0ABR3QBX5_9TREE